MKIQWLKRTMWVLLTLLMLLMLFLLWLLQTESGARWGLKQVFTSPEVTFEFTSLSGSLSDGLTLEDLHYQDSNLSLNVSKFSYQSEWHWLDRHVEVTSLDANGIHIKPLPSTDSSEESEKQDFQGFNMPVSVAIEASKLRDLNLYDQQHNLLQVINAVIVKGDAVAQTIHIQQLNVDSEWVELSTSGQIKLSNEILVNLEIQGSWQADDWHVETKGSLQGGLSDLLVEQQVNIKQQDNQIQYALSGQVQNLPDQPKFDLTISDGLGNYSAGGEALEFDALEAHVTGTPEDYSLALQAQWTHPKLGASELMIDGQGDLNQFKAHNAQIQTLHGHAKWPFDVAWSDRLMVQSQIELSGFDPALFDNTWPGNLDGQLKLELSGTSQFSLDLSGVDIKGQLRQHAIQSGGSIRYSADGLLADQFQVVWGDNRLFAQGMINESEINADLQLDLNDLANLDPQLAGNIAGNLKLWGDPNAPNVDANLTGSELTYQAYQAADWQFKVGGKVNQSVQTELSMAQLSMDDVVLNQVKFTQLGWLNDHRVSVDFESDALNNVLAIQGGFLQPSSQGTNPSQNPMPFWQRPWVGEMVSQKITFEGGQQLNLQSPISLKWDQALHASEGCWLGDQDERMCIKMDQWPINGTSISGQLTLQHVAVNAFKLWLPETLDISGELIGQAQFDLGLDQMWLEAQVELLQGQVAFNHDQAQRWQQKIEHLKLSATTNNDQVTWKLDGVLQDTSFIQVEGELAGQGSGPWQVESEIEGYWHDVRILAEVSDEISQSDGSFAISGEVVGPVTKPRIELSFVHQDGLIKLARLGTLIQDLKMNLHTEGVNQPIYQVHLAGKNVAEINQGHIESFGELSRNKQQWHYQGTLKGQNFMILNTPELTFTVSPDLSISMRPTGMEINGDMVLNSGSVVIQQLPPETIANDPDLVVHSTDSITQNYPVNLNINTSIESSVALDVLGLEADLTGQLALIQRDGQGIKGSGELNLGSGSYTLYGQKLEIETGEVIFNGPIDNPQLNIIASRQSIAGDVKAGVKLGGSVQSLESELFSTPNLSELEQLTYIMTGRGVEGASDIDGDQLKQAAIVLGLNQSNPIFNQIKNQFGIDVLTVKESKFAKDTVIEAGKRINDRLYVSYNQGLFNRLGFWVLKYRINQFLNLQSTRGEDQSLELVYIRKAKRSGKNSTANQD